MELIISNKNNIFSKFLPNIRVGKKIFFDDFNEIFITNFNLCSPSKETINYSNIKSMTTSEETSHVKIATNLFSTFSTNYNDSYDYETKKVTDSLSISLILTDGTTRTINFITRKTQQDSFYYDTKYHAYVETVSKLNEIISNNKNK